VKFVMCLQGEAICSVAVAEKISEG